MDVQQLTQVFAYLALTYILDGLLISLSRRIRLPDFLAHLLTGVLLGAILYFYADLFSNSLLERLEKNTFITQLSYVGLLLFLMQLGFNVDLTFFRINANRTLRQVVSLTLLTLLFFTLLGYFLLSAGDLQAAAILAAAFLSINIGAVLAANFPSNPKLKTPFTNLIQTAVIVDFLAIVLFASFQFVGYFQKQQPDRWSQNLLYAALLLLFVLPVFFPRRTDLLFKRLENLLQEFASLLKLGCFFLFVFVGLSLGISILLVGIWGGVLFRIFAGEGRFDVTRRMFSAFSFLYILPFVDIGQTLFFGWSSHSPQVWFQVTYILLLLVLISLIFGFAFYNIRGFVLLKLLGIFPRGELSLILLWLGLKLKFIEPGLFVVAVLAVLISSLLGNLAFFRPLRSGQE